MSPNGYRHAKWIRHALFKDNREKINPSFHRPTIYVYNDRVDCDFKPWIAINIGEILL